MFPDTKTEKVPENRESGGESPPSDPIRNPHPTPEEAPESSETTVVVRGIDRVDQIERLAAMQDRLAGLARGSAKHIRGVLSLPPEDIEGTSFTEELAQEYDQKAADHERTAELLRTVGDLVEAIRSIENDDGRIPATIWDMRNAALSRALGVTPGVVNEAAHG